MIPHWLPICVQRGQARSTAPRNWLRVLAEVHWLTDWLNCNFSLMWCTFEEKLVRVFMVQEKIWAHYQLVKVTMWENIQHENVFLLYLYFWVCRFAEHECSVSDTVRPAAHSHSRTQSQLEAAHYTHSFICWSLSCPSGAVPFDLLLLQRLGVKPWKNNLT